MKYHDGNIEKLLKEISKSYFRKNDINDFFSRHKVDIEYTNNKSELVNLLVTFASGKLKDYDLYEFLFHLAKTMTAQGELPTSISIYKSLINFVKRIDNVNETKARAYIGLADLYSQIAEWDQSLKFCRAAERIYKPLNNYKGLAKVENLFGIIEGDHGNIVKAQKHFKASLAFLKYYEDLSLKGKLLTNLGIIENILGNFAEAISYYEEAVSTFEINKNYERAAEIKHNLGMLFLKKHEYNFAIAKFDESITDSLKSKYLQHLGISYLSKAEAYTRLSEFEIAETFAKKALEISNKINDKLTIADTYKVKGIIQRSRNNFESAENYFLTSMRINNELGNKLNQAETAYELGILYKEIKKNEESKKYFYEALTYFKKNNAFNEIKEIKNHLPN